MSQRQQLERILEIDRRIRAGLYPNPEKLASELEISRRAIFNDRDFLVNRLGAPLRYDRAKGGWYYTDPTWSLPSALVTEKELLAMILGVEVARRYVGTALEAPLLSGVEKIARGLKGPVTVDLEALGREVSVGGPCALAADQETLALLHGAIRNRRKVSMRYFTAYRSARTDRTVDPYHLHLCAGDWYLLGYDAFRGGVRTFNVGRIEWLEVLEEKFKREAGFEVERHIGASFLAENGQKAERVIIAFDHAAAVYVRERRWHPTQEVEDLAGGGCILRLQTSGLGQVKRWVLQFGGGAEVLGPKSLREAMAGEVLTLFGRYHRADGRRPAPPVERRKRGSRGVH